MSRKLSESFIKELQAGFLSGLKEAVIADKDLYYDSLAKRMIDFADQIKVFQTGFAIWKDKLKPIFN